MKRRPKSSRTVEQSENSRGVERRSGRNEERATERRSGRDRRSNQRVALNLEAAGAVLVRGDEGLVRGMARNVSQGGMLVEMEELPGIGSHLEITFAALGNASAITLHGEVRHHVSWQHSLKGQPKTMRGVG